MMEMMEDIEDDTQQNIINEPPLIARHSMKESPPNVIDMSMEENYIGCSSNTLCRR
jgi:hypothetical protein